MTFTMRPRHSLFLLLAAGLALGGCSKSAPHDHDAHADEGGHAHEHAAPHGGTLVVLGEEAFHLELVLTPATGRLEAYVLDGEAEKFLRIAQPALAIDIVRDGVKTALVLPAIADAATGETVGDTALFALETPALVGAERFDGTVKTVTVRGVTFDNVAFRFPEGNEAH